MGTDTYIKKDPQKIYRQENLIMLCDSDWVVIGIIDKGMTIGEEGIIGNDISQLLSEESLQKSILFKERLEEKKIVLGFEMSVDTDQGKYLLTFSGIKIDNSYLVIASNNNNLLSELFDEMSRISNEQINMIRAMAQEKVKVAKIARERIERDLHDSVSQTIFSTRIIAEILPELWKRDKVEAKKQLQKIKMLAEDSLTEMRRILLELRPDAFAEEDIGDLLGQLIKSAMLRSDIKIDLELKGKAQPNAQLKEAIYRITQEAINNSIKHSQAKNIKIEASFSKNETALIVSDDGIGFDDDDVSKKNLGLYIMHERAKALGASLDISSTKDKGTKIRFNYKDKKR